MSIATTAAGKEDLARLLFSGAPVTIDRLPGLLRHLKPDGLAGLPLPDGRTIDSMAVRSNVLHLQTDHVTASELAIDRQIEQR